MADIQNTKNLTLDEYVLGVQSGDRAVLARAITLVESTKPEHQRLAQDLLQKIWSETGKTHRIGITGVPGVGKSTMIDQLGSNLTVQGHKVAVLAVDPTSQRTGGSILGDKTRMPKLAVDPNAFIRPSPTSGTLGGVTKKTRETMALCEAAGFDIILVETVGVGQSETAVSEMVDFFLVLMLPGAGDELQGLKKGVLEIADMIAINKADGDNEVRARHAAGEYQAALHILTPTVPDWSPPVVLISGLKNTGLDEMWVQIEKHREVLNASGAFQERRQTQAVKWMHDMLEHRFMSALRNNSDVEKRLSTVEAQVRQGIITPARAVDEIIELADVNTTEKS